MGEPKLSLPLGSETMLGRVVRTIGSVVKPVAVVASASQVVPELPDGVEILRDEQPELGPLGGLVSGLAAMRSVVDAVYLSACDVPLLTAGFVERVIDLLGDHELVILRDGRYYHPLAAVYRVDLESRIRRLIAADQLRPFFLVESSVSRIVDVEEMRGVDSELQSLRNVNKPEEYAALLREMENGA